MQKPQPPRTAPPATRPERSTTEPPAAERPTTRRPAAGRPARSPPQRPASAPPSSGAVAAAWARHPLVAMVRHRQHLTFYEGLYQMLRAGLPLNTAFVELSRGAAGSAFHQAIAQVGRAVESGSTLAEALRRFPRWFNPQVVAVLGAAEATGTLEGALARHIEQMKEAQQLRWQTVMFCIYPGYLLGAFILGGAALDAAGAIMASSGNGDMLVPAFLSSLTRSVGWTVGLGLAAFGAPLAVAALSLEEPWERIRAQLPLLGGLHRAFHASRFCQTLGASLGAGVEVARGLELALAATGSTVLGARTAQATYRLRSGASLTDVVEHLGVLDGDSLRQLSTAERTGQLDTTLARLAQERAESGMRRLRTLLFLTVSTVGVLLGLASVGKIFGLQASYFRLLQGLE